MSNTKENYVLTQEIFDKMFFLNESYENVVKVLLATIEALSEKMPIAIYNESRAFTDHLARCYVKNEDKEYICEQLNRAERHLNRMIMDCYKELFLIYYQRIEDFKKFTKRVDLSYVASGEFYVEYKKLLTDAEEKKIEAKKCVSYEEDYIKFEEACIAYYKLDKHIQRYLVEVQTIKLKTNTKKIVAFLVWLATTILSGLLANNNQSIVEFVKNLFGNFIR